MLRHFIPRNGNKKMLKKLKIKNFAIIDEIEMFPSAGLNVFTGETGAGKSIIIEALSFILGARAGADLIKRSADTLEVSACFDTLNLPKKIKERHKITADEICLKRRLDRNGRSKGFINDKVSSISAISEIGDWLVDFHGQYEHQTLLKPQVHLDFLDRFAGLSEQLKEVSAVFVERQNILKRLDEVKLSETEKEKLLDLYKFQLDEIENAEIKPNEDIELENTLPRLKNAHKLLELSQTAYEKLYSGEGSAVEKISAGAKALQELSSIDPSMEEVSRCVNQALVSMEDAAGTISDYRESIDINSARLDGLIARQDKLAMLKKKYGVTLEDVLNHKTGLETRISDLELSGQKITELENQAKKLNDNLKTLCQNLHNKRMTEAKKLSALVACEIRPLGFENIKFDVSVEMDEEDITRTGADKVEFLFSSNPGEPLKPLKNIASGGEISRVMLGLKNVLSEKGMVSVFDEIDAGIGGETGRLVGKKLKKISKGGQMFVITHLAQIAGFADSHCCVFKHSGKNSVSVCVNQLDKKQRTLEISRMLSGRKTSQTSLKHAEELIAECD